MKNLIWIVWLGWLALLLPIDAHANCTYPRGSSTEQVSFSPPSTLSIKYNLPVGSILWTSTTVTPNPSSNTITCDTTTNYGVQNVIGATPTSSTTIFPTNVPGVGYIIMHPDSSDFLLPYPLSQIAGGSYQMSVASTLEFVKTGTIATGSTVSAGTLGYWFFASNLRAEAFTLANSMTITETACSVNTTPINVTLPTLAVSSLASVGATAGRTPFNISLSCSSGMTLSIQLNFNGTNTGITGVLSNSSASGAAAGVDVQLLDQTFKPVSFGTTTTLGATPDGTWNILYYAQYYRAGAISAGSVSSSATFTLTYQ